MTEIIFYKKPLFVVLAGLALACASLPAQARPTRGIRSIDFRNFTFESETMGSITLHGGMHQQINEKGEASGQSKLMFLQYVDLNKDGKPEAVIAIRHTQPSSMPISVDYYVFAYDKGKAQEILHEWSEWDAGISVKGNLLILVGPRWQEGDAHCCPRYIEKKIYGWTKQGLVLLRKRWRKPRMSEDIDKMSGLRRDDCHMEIGLTRSTGSRETSFSPVHECCSRL